MIVGKRNALVWERPGLNNLIFYANKDEAVQVNSLNVDHVVIEKFSVFYDDVYGQHAAIYYNEGHAIW